MSLRPEVSLPVALATGTLVYAIYSKALPSHTDIRVGKQGDQDIEASRHQSAWVAAAAVSAISLMAKDATVFIVGGAMVVALDVLTRHANWTNPLTGKVDLGDVFKVEKRNETPADSAGAPYLEAVV